MGFLRRNFAVELLMEGGTELSREAQQFIHLHSQSRSTLTIDSNTQEDSRGALDV